MATATLPIRTSERIGVSLPATVTVYLNGVAQGSTSVTLAPPLPSVLTVAAGDISTVHESFVVGSRPVVVFVREIAVMDRTSMGEVVRA